MSGDKVIISREEYDKLLLFQANAEQKIREAEENQKKVTFLIRPADQYHNMNVPFNFQEIVVDGPGDFESFSRELEEKVNSTVVQMNSTSKENYQLTQENSKLKQTLKEIRNWFKYSLTLDLD